MAKPWQEFQDLVGREIKYLYPQSAGWKVEEQKPLMGDKYRVDYVAYKGSERCVIDAKWVKELQKSDVNQVIEYKKLYKAQKAIIYVNQNTKVSHDLMIIIGAITVIDRVMELGAEGIEIKPLTTDP